MGLWALRLSRAAAMLRAMSTPSAAASARILVVEDESAIADTLLYALRSEGYAVELCALGRQALARQREAPADLVLLDIGLPDLASRSAAACALSARCRWCS